MFRSAAAIAATATLLLLAGLGGAAYGDSGSSVMAPGTEAPVPSTTAPTAEEPLTTTATAPPTTTTTASPTATSVPTTTTSAPAQAPGRTEPAPSSPAPTPAPAAAPTPEPGCSAAALGLDGVAPQVGLPAEVAAARDAIVAAAVACDWHRLDTLTAGEFAYSYGVGPRPVSYWQDLEARGEPATAQMVIALTFSHGVDDQFDQPIYYWPAALSTAPGSAEWEELAGIYGADALAAMAELGGFTGDRHGIRADGDWRFFILGS